MGLNNFILTCEKDNTELRKDIEYYKNYNKRLKQENKILRENAEHNDKVVDKVNWENRLLKEVIEEVREYIDNNTEFEHDGDEYGYTEWVNIKPQNIVFIDELLQILDKAKENK